MCHLVWHPPEVRTYPPAQSTSDYQTASWAARLNSLPSRSPGDRSSSAAHHHWGFKTLTCHFDGPRALPQPALLVQGHLAYEPRRHGTNAALTCMSILRHTSPCGLAVMAGYCAELETRHTTLPSLPGACGHHWTDLGATSACPGAYLHLLIRSHPGRCPTTTSSHSSPHIQRCLQPLWAPGGALLLKYLLCPHHFPGHRMRSVSRQPFPSSGVLSTWEAHAGVCRRQGATDTSLKPILLIASQ